MYMKEDHMRNGQFQGSEDKLAQINYALYNSQGAMKKLDFYYDQFQGCSCRTAAAGLS
jgi:hypothetical protein